MTDEKAYRRLGRTRWDVVCQFMVFRPEQMQLDIDILTGSAGQYVFAHSASQTAVSSGCRPAPRPAAHVRFGPVLHFDLFSPGASSAPE